MFSPRAGRARREAMRAFPPCAIIAVLVIALLPAAAHGARDVRVGIGDQSLALFDDPTFRSADFRQVRYFVHWNTIHERDQRLAMRAWVKKARSQGMRPLIHLSTTDFTPKKAPRPSVSHYKSDVGRLVRYLRRLGVRDFGTFNEANHKTQPTWDSPNHAALYFRAIYRAVRKTCTMRSCRVVALDVLDQPGVERYIERFYDRLRSRTWKRRAEIIGIHNYADVNYDTRTRTRGIIKEVRDHNRGANFWFTETGGLVGFGRNFPCDPTSPSSLRRAEERAADAVDNVFELANTYRGVGVQRIYIYNWFGNTCATNERIDPSGRDPDELAGFDAGLVRADGTPRPGLDEVRQALRGSFKR
jgi:hypothetical protein